MKTYVQMIMEQKDYETAFPGYIVSNLIETNRYSHCCDIEKNVSFLKNLKSEIESYTTEDEKKISFLNKTKLSIERDIDMYNKKLS